MNQTDEIDVTIAVGAFRSLISAGWASVNNVATGVGSENLVSDWMQAMWESIVEMSIPDSNLIPSIEIYGDGADCFGGSSRFSRYDVLPNFVIECRGTKSVPIIDQLNGKRLPVLPQALEFDRFVSMQETWYAEIPPFDCVLLSSVDGNTYVILADGLQWIAKPKLEKNRRN